MNHSQNICHKANDTWQPKDDKYKLIFIDICDKKDMGVVIFNTVVAFLLLVYILMGFWKRKQMIPSHRPQKRLFVGLLLWALFSICQFLYAIITYVLNKEYMKDHGFSRGYFAFDSIPAFIVQTLFIYIPLNMTNNLLQLRADSGQTIPLSQIRFYQAMKFYARIRYLFLIPKLGILIPWKNKAAYYILFKISIWLTILDAMICNAALLYMDRFIFRQLTEISPSDRKTLRRQVYSISIACMCRWIVDILCIVIKGVLVDINHTLLYLFIGMMFMHFIPVSFIIKMHFPEEQKDSSSSLVLSQND